VTAQDFERSLLALESWREAGDDSVDQMLCIAWTIMNLGKRDNLSIGEALRQHKNLHGVDDSNGAFPDVREPRFMRLLQQINDVGTQFGEDLTNGAIYYTEISKPDTALAKELAGKPNEHPLSAVFGKRHFFK
jgi:hypothetical protein